MKKKLFSHPRWWDVPVSRTSLCTTCKYWLGFENCIKRGKVPLEMIKKSFRGSENFDENYCRYREEKTE